MLLLQSILCHFLNYFSLIFDSSITSLKLAFQNASVFNLNNTIHLSIYFQYCFLHPTHLSGLPRYGSVVNSPANAGV